MAGASPVPRVLWQGAKKLPKKQILSMLRKKTAASVTRVVEGDPGLA